MIHLKITPDSRITNEHIEQLVQTLCIYQSPLSRWNKRGFDKHHFVSFETVLKKNQTSFIFTVQDEMESVTRKSIETAFPKASIEKVEDPLQTKPSLISSVELKYHYMFAIKVDRRENSHLSSILETLNLMAGDDEIFIQSLCVPASQDWYQSAVDAYENFKKGDMPTKIRLNKQGIAKTGLKVVGSTVLGAIGIVQELFTGEEPEKINLNEGERALILRDGHLSSATLQKVRGDAYDTMIRIAIACSDSKRAKALMRMITMAFRELDGDNQLVARETPVERTWKLMQKRDMGFRMQSDNLSIAEISRLFLMPSGTLQEKYHIPNIENLEVEISEDMTKGGILIGSHEIKRKRQNAYQPIDNWDELCLPNVTIAGMGQGKTKGFGANWIVQAVQNGFGAMAIDPAKHEIGDEVEKALPKDKVVRINLAKTLFSLDWCEVKYSQSAKNILANAVLSFFDNNSDDAGAQTTRYIRAAVMAMRTGKLSEIIRIFEDKEYREQVIKDMQDNLHKLTLQKFNEEGDKRQNQILSPIYNRLDVILGDHWLEQCMESDSSLDMVELMSERKAIIFDVAKKDGLVPEQIDLIVNLLTTKINLAMQLRTEENQFPFFVLYDEPHQFLKSARLWKSLAVESRKWRVGFIWLFHDWIQIPRDLRQIIKSALPHYHLYPSDKLTYKELEYEIQPYTIQDGIKLKQYHAINVIRHKGEVKPFIAKMAPPPSENKLLNVHHLW